MLNGSCTSATTCVIAVICSTAPTTPSSIALTRLPRCAMTMRHCQMPTSVTTRAAISNGRNTFTSLIVRAGRSKGHDRDAAGTDRGSEPSAHRVGRAPHTGRPSVRPLEGTAEGLFGVVPDAPRNGADTEVGGGEEVLREMHAPFGQVADRRPAEHVTEARVEHRARHRCLAGEIGDRPVARGFAVQQR